MYLSDDHESLRKLVEKILGDPTLYPSEFKGFLPRFLETSDMRLPAAQVFGVQPKRVSTSEFASLSPGSTEMEVLLTVDSTNGIYWHLRYNPSSASSYKWEFLGGPPLYAYVATQEATSSTSYTALSTPGPSVTTPRGGEYYVRFAAEMAVTDSGAAQAYAYTAVKVGAAATSDADALIEQSLGSAAGLNQYGVNSNTFKKTLATNDVVKLEYRAGAGTVTFNAAKRSLAIVPVRVG